MSIPRTCTTADIFKAVEFSSSVAYETFRAVPIVEIRKKCLDVMRRFYWLSEMRLAEVETDLRWMVGTDDPLWEDYLFLYVGVSRNDPIRAKRAATFVLETVTRVGTESVRSRLMRHLILYREENYPLIRNFLHSEVHAFLVTISKHPDYPRYEEADWYRLTRALGILTKRGDYGTCITTVQSIAEWLAGPRTHPSFAGTGPDLQRFLIVQHRAYVREALRQVKLAKAAADEPLTDVPSYEGPICPPAGQ